MLGKDKPQGPGWVRAVPALGLSGEQSLYRALLAGLGRTWRTLFLSLRTEPQRLLSRPLSLPCTQQEGGLSSEGCWQEGLLQPAGGLCDKPGDIPAAPCSC